jgi:hypothetical protein
MSDSATIDHQSSPPLMADADHVAARATGVFYLALGITGMLGFLVVRPALVDPDAAVTLVNLQEHETLARVGIALEMAVVLAQSLAAVWFYRLFRAVDAFAAGAIAVFGMMNAAAIMASGACLATALQAALGDAGAGADTPQLMYALSENFWGVGNLFFGLWLIPMGWCVLRSGTMPRLLGRLLMVSGIGYVLSGFATYLLPEAELVVLLLAAPATVGEFWMIGYLLVRGAGRPSAEGR